MTVEFIKTAARDFMELFVADNGDERALTVVDIDHSELTHRYSALEDALEKADSEENEAVSLRAALKGLVEDLEMRATNGVVNCSHGVYCIARAALSTENTKPQGEGESTPAPVPHKAGPTDSELLDALASNSWDLRCISVPTGGDDHDIDWIVIEHHQAKPHERTIAQAYADDPRAAVRRAIRSTDPNAARCVSCDEVLHDGDSVYYEQGEGGHIHSWCASDDPESFVDEDEVPLKAGDEIPKPFAYSAAPTEGQP